MRTLTASRGVYENSKSITWGYENSKSGRERQRESVIGRERGRKRELEKERERERESGRERERAISFAFIVLQMSCFCKCFALFINVPFGWSAVCDCGIS